ncbi:transcription factor bHLH168-like [Cornus florida]|uniref:transcription factor bHLH168-like n=1 Tax=Cornus florida TaxID=4283 RepID=UPI00289E8C9D|nr:transcription factor bHLH168-like [Cornus florida]
MKPESHPCKLGRNVVERKRRLHMKNLFCRLATLLITSHCKGRLPSPQDLLDRATTYVKQLQEKVEKLKQRMEQIKGGENSGESNMGSNILPELSVREVGSTLEVNLITGRDKSFMLHEVVSVLGQEGAEVVSASYSTVDDKVFYTIVSQAIWSRIGIETSRVHERLKNLIF